MGGREVMMIMAALILFSGEMVSPGLVVLALIVIAAAATTPWQEQQHAALADLCRTNYYHVPHTHMVCECPPDDVEACIASAATACHPKSPWRSGAKKRGGFGLGCNAEGRVTMLITDNPHECGLRGVLNASIGLLHDLEFIDIRSSPGLSGRLPDSLCGLR